MSQPYVGEIRMFGGNFAPAGWMFCSGQLLPISENETLFNLIGTTYGGDGQSTFALPNLQSRVPVHVGGPPTYVLGETAGVESVTLTGQTIAAHTHPIQSANNPADANIPSGNTILANMGPSGIAQVPCYKAYDGAAQIVLNGGSVSTVGGSQPHDNIQPYLAINYIISLFGIYPPPN